MVSYPVAIIFEISQHISVRMPSLKKTFGTIVAGLAALTSALPAAPKLTKNQLKLWDLAKRQNDAAAAAGLTDIDILQL